MRICIFWPLCWRKSARAVTVPFPKSAKFIENRREIRGVKVLEAPEFSGRMDYYAEELKRLIRESYKIVVSCVSDERKRSLSEFAERMEISAGPGVLTYVSGVLPLGLSASELARLLSR